MRFEPGRPGLQSLPVLDPARAAPRGFQVRRLGIVHPQGDLVNTIAMPPDVLGDGIVRE